MMSFNFLKGAGNHSIEVSRLAWFAAVVAGIGYTGAHLIMNHAFDIIQFGTGMGLLNAGSGGATAMKDNAVAKAAVKTAGIEDDK